MRGGSGEGTRCGQRPSVEPSLPAVSWYTKNGLPLPGATLWQAVMSVVWLVQPIRTWYIYIYAATCRPVRGTKSGFFHGVTIVAVVAPMAASRRAIGTLASSSTGGNTTKPTSHKSDGDACHEHRDARPCEHRGRIRLHTVR